MPDSRSGRVDKSDGLIFGRKNVEIGILLIVNFLSIPFIGEAEKLGVAQKRFPSMIDILRLSNVRKERWFGLYLIFMVIFSAIALFPSSSDSEFSIEWPLIAKIGVAQAIVWFVVVYRIRK
ncbi:hypothetical protein ACDA63_06680 [Uliginosibacterium sp. sgz301328]|uniref:hypothetical protein n=1 Tax=Uliginosibacterium sp. sgz301328 TaxID=3243764 RepID=UPI00359E7714